MEGMKCQVVGQYVQKMWVCELEWYDGRGMVICFGFIGGYMWRVWEMKLEEKLGIK